MLWGGTMKKLNRNYEIRMLVEILYEKSLINRKTYLAVIDELNRNSDGKAA